MKSSVLRNGLIWLFLVISVTLVKAQETEKDFALLLQQAREADKATLYWEWGEQLLLTRSADSTILLARTGIKLAEKHKQVTVHSQLLGVIGRNFAYSGQTDSALYYFDQAIDLVEDIDFETVTYLVSRRLEALVAVHRYQEVLDFAAPYMDRPEIIRHKRSWANVLLSVADAYSRTFRHEEALQYAMMMLQLAEEQQFYPQIISANILISSIYSYQGKYYLALRHTLDVTGYTEYMSPNQVLVSYANLGVSYSRVEEYDKAIAAYNKVLELKHNAPKHQEAWTIGRIGSVYLKQEKFEEALTYYRQAGEMYNALEMKMDVLYNDLFIAKTLWNMDDFSASQKTAGSIYKRLSKIPNEQGRLNYSWAYAFFWLAKSTNSLNEYIRAREYVDECLRYADMVRNVELTREVSELAGMIYENTVQSEEALVHLRRFISLKDSVDVRHLQAKVIGWESKLELEEKDFEAKELSLSYENLDLRKKSDTRLAMVLLCLALLIIGILASRLRIKKKNLELIRHEGRLNDKLSQRQLELSSLRTQILEVELRHHGLRIQQKNEIIHEMKQELKRAENEEGRIQMIPNLSEVVEQSLSPDHDWDSFTSHFEQIHPQFFSTLASEYPDLTQNELRISALIKLGMGSEEIASILNVKPTSVAKSRDRLKAKTGADSDEHLREIISSL